MWGFLSGLLIAALIAGVILLLRVSLNNTTTQVHQNQVPDARVELSVSADGCGVERSAVTGSSAVDSLTWVIRDTEGYTVLERNAENEFKYRYFGSGSYTISINAWFDGQYHQISDEVRIDC